MLDTSQARYAFSPQIYSLLVEERAVTVLAVARLMSNHSIKPSSRAAARTSSSTSGTFTLEPPASVSASSTASSSRLPISSSFPAVRLSESKDYVTVSAVVPGFAEGDLEITLAKDLLCITGQHRSEVPGGFTSVQRGRRSADFKSEIKLLNEVAWDDTEAHLERGVLTIRLRKDAPSSRPAIPIRLT